MRIQRGQLKSSGLNSQIEIIRDNHNVEQERRPPPLSDSENALLALNELVERLEALEQLPLVTSESVPLPETNDSQRAERERCMTDVDRYLTLFQRQSAVLRRLSGKLN